MGFGVEDLVRLELRRRKVAQRRMKTLRVLHHLDVLRQAGREFLERPHVHQVHFLGLERLEETLRDRIVVRVPLPRHADLHPVPFRQSHVIPAGLLDRRGRSGG